MSLSLTDNPQESPRYPLYFHDVANILHSHLTSFDSSLHNSNYSRLLQIFEHNSLHELHHHPHADSQQLYQVILMFVECPPLLYSDFDDDRVCTSAFILLFLLYNAATKIRIDQFMYQLLTQLAVTHHDVHVLFNRLVQVNAFVLVSIGTRHGPVPTPYHLFQYCTSSSHDGNSSSTIHANNDQHQQHGQQQQQQQYQNYQNINPNLYHSSYRTNTTSASASASAPPAVMNIQSNIMSSNDDNNIPSNSNTDNNNNNNNSNINNSNIHPNLPPAPPLPPSVIAPAQSSSSSTLTSPCTPIIVAPGVNPNCGGKNMKNAKEEPVSVNVSNGSNKGSVRKYTRKTKSKRKISKKNNSNTNSNSSNRKLLPNSTSSTCSKTK